MSKRNLILLIIILVIIITGAFWYFYFYQSVNQNVNNTENTNFFGNFLPFGKSKSTTSPNNNENQSTDISGYESITEEETLNIKLEKVSSFPIAGYEIFIKERYKETTNPQQTTKETESLDIISNIPILETNTLSTELVPALRYVNKATGNIYQTFADKIDERKFSSLTIPRVYEAFFGNKGESVVMRYLKTDNKTIETFVGTLPKEFLGADSSETNEIKGSFLPENISDISVSPDTSKIFYLFNIEDNAIGITLSLSTNTKVQVFNSPFTEWLSFWPNDKMITLTTKPSANIPGFMYITNPETKDFNKILSGINGLTTLTSPSGKLVLYSNNNLSLSVFNTDTKESSSIGLKTLPEKCVWGTASDVVYCAVPKYTNRVEYPDSWYQGEVSFSDEIWKVDTTNGNTIMILDPLTIKDGEEVDAIKLDLDENQNYLFFVNKKDSYLWKINLK